MNRIKRILGIRNVLERAWAETQLESPDTVMVADGEAAQALEAMRQAYLASQGQPDKHGAP